MPEQVIVLLAGCGPARCDATVVRHFLYDQAAAPQGVAERVVCLLEQLPTQAAYLGPETAEAALRPSNEVGAEGHVAEYAGEDRGAQTCRYDLPAANRLLESGLMAQTGVVIDRRYLEHDTGPGHPERPERIATLLALLTAAEADIMPVAARAASGDELALVHDGAYVEEVAATQRKAYFAFDADTPTSPQSYDTARLAAGGLLALLDEIMGGTVDDGFAFVRPPGHHAERHRAMGFCLFNNVAVGAAYLRHRYGLQRVLIMDWDVHHGNGTQHIFEDDPRLLYISTHQYPYYPGTGAVEEVGYGDGEGYTVNLPFPAGFGDAEYGEAFTRIVEPIARQYAPQFVLISAGFDAHARDPLGGMQVTEGGFKAMARSLLAVARECASGRCAAILEGGYDLTAIRDSASEVLQELRQTSGAELAAPTEPSRAAALLERIREVQGRYWKL